MGSTATSTTSRRSPRVRRGFVIAVVSVSTLFAIVLSVRTLQRPEGLEGAAHNVLSALVAGDAATLMKYVAPEEQEASGLDESSLQELLDRVFLPAFEGCDLKNTYRWEYSNDVSYTLVGNFDCNGEVAASVHAQVYLGDPPVSPSLAFNTVMFALTAYGRAAYPGLSGTLARYKAYRDLRPIFESLRLTKVWLAFKGRALSWDDIEARLRDEAMRAAPPR